jgi:alpha/beta superfamily hydrolase
MHVPSILRGESRTRLLQGIAIGAVASMVIGFSWGGWMTGGAANKIAAERADTAVVAALTLICVEKFLQNSDAKANLAVLQRFLQAGNKVTTCRRAAGRRSRGLLPPTTT